MASSLTNIQSFFGAGFERAQFALSSSGLPFDTANPPAQDGAVGMTTLKGANTANPTLGTSEVLQVQGDNGVIGVIQFPPNALPTFDLSFTNFDASFMNSTQGTTTDDVQSVYDFMLIDPADRPVVDMFLLLTQRGGSSVAGEEGNGYINLLFPLCTATLTGLPNMQTGSNVGEYTYSVVVNRVSQFPWGEAITTGNHGTGAAAGFIFFSDEIPTFDVYCEDGSTGEHTPLQTLNANNQVIGWSDITGSMATLATAVSSGDFTFTAQTADEYHLFMYEV